jgi:Holliday junction resolvase-like predicted endonuclease
VVSDWYHYGMAMTLRLTPEQDAQLTAVAQALNLSKQQAATQAIEEFLESRDQEVLVKRAFDLVLKRDAELLRRLADA